MPDHLAEAIRGRVGADGRLTCASALALATDLGQRPLRVGQAADALPVKLTRCELGLFGPRRVDEHDAAPMPDTLRRRLATAGPNLSCAAAWAIARDLGISPLDVGRAATALSIHISHCQLGCF